MFDPNIMAAHMLQAQAVQARAFFDQTLMSSAFLPQERQVAETPVIIEEIEDDPPKVEQKPKRIRASAKKKIEAPVLEVCSLLFFLL